MTTYTLKPGYAYAFHEAGFSYEDIPNEMWETEIVGEEECKRAGYVGSTFIDGTLCAVFVDDFDGAHYAQTEVYCEA